MPWRRFALDSNDAAGSESEDEIYDISSRPNQSATDRSNDSIDPKISPICPSASPKESSQSESKSRSTLPTNNLKSPKKSIEGTECHLSIVLAKLTIESSVLSDSHMSSDEESLDRYNLNSSRIERNEFISSGSDTEDEIRRVLAKESSSIASTKAVRKSSSNSNDDIYNVTTEEEINNTPNPSTATITPLPEFFKGIQFYLSRNISSTDEIKLKRFITVYGGTLTIAATNSDYIVSNSAKETPPQYKGEVVKPLWIFECNDLEMLLPTKRYNFSNW